MKNTLTLKVLVSIIVISMILAIANIANAYSLNGSLTSSDKLVSGANVKVTFSISAIDMAEGVTGISVDKVNYDTSVFETVTKSSFSTSGDWEVAGYSTTSQALTLKNDAKSTSDCTVVTLTLKVKEGVTNTETSVSFDGITATAGLTTGDVALSVSPCKIYADKASEGGTGSGSSTPATTEKENTANTAKNTAKKITATKSNKKILAAGDATTIVLSVVGIIVLAVAVVGFVNYAKNKDVK